jgi:oligopeptide transport system ATP-binding protein
MHLILNFVVAVNLRRFKVLGHILNTWIMARKNARAGAHLALVSQAAADMAAEDLVIDVRNLVVHFKVHQGEVAAVRNVSLQVRKGETLCIVGESGSGKSVTMQAIMGLLPTPPARIVSGQAFLGADRNVDLLSLSHHEMRKYLGSEIAMIFQDPLASLNPTMTVERQIEESLILHTDLNATERYARVLELMELVRIPEPKQRMQQFPHELSGGMRQRVMIAMALACNPKLLIADEPTTALDVTIQAQILSLLKDLSVRLNMATILITHDLGVVAQMADRVAVMYAGKIVEEGSVREIFHRPRHPYTLALKQAMPEGNARDSQRLVSIQGTPPDLFQPPRGCAFAARCHAAMSVCHQYQPPAWGNETQRVSCWLHHDKATIQRQGMGIAELNAGAEGANYVS